MPDSKSSLGLLLVAVGLRHPLSILDLLLSKCSWFIHEPSAFFCPRPTRMQCSREVANSAGQTIIFIRTRRKKMQSQLTIKKIWKKIMQLFGLHPHPRRAALKMKAWVRVNSQARETTQLLYTALHIHKQPITDWVRNRRNRYVIDINKRRIRPYKPFAASHPITMQVAASQAHFHWALSHALKLCKLWAKKSRDGKKHGCLAHLRHIQHHIDKFELPEGMPESIHVR